MGCRASRKPSYGYNYQILLVDSLLLFVQAAEVFGLNGQPVASAVDLCGAKSIGLKRVILMKMNSSLIFVKMFCFCKCSQNGVLSRRNVQVGFGIGKSVIEKLLL